MMMMMMMQVFSGGGDHGGIMQYSTCTVDGQNQEKRNPKSLKREKEKEYNNQWKRDTIVSEIGISYISLLFIISDETDCFGFITYLLATSPNSGQSKQGDEMKTVSPEILCIRSSKDNTSY